MIAGLVLIGAALAMVVSGCAPTSQPSGGTGEASQTPAGNPVLSNEKLSEIAPGLGTVMVETGYRNWVLFYAGNGGNWGLASYQAKEIGEILEVGATTRPKRAALIDDFLNTSLKPLNDAIKAEDKTAFKQAWDAEVQACNECHNQTDFSYIQWKLPPTPPPDLDVTISSSAATASVPATGSTGTTSP